MAHLINFKLSKNMRNVVNKLTWKDYYYFLYIGFFIDFEKRLKPSLIDKFNEVQLQNWLLTNVSCCFYFFTYMKYREIYVVSQEIDVEFRGSDFWNDVCLSKVCHLCNRNVWTYLTKFGLWANLAISRGCFTFFSFFFW